MSALPTRIDRPENFASVVAPRSRVFFAVAAIATLFALVGFWPTYFGPLVIGRVDASWLIHLHAVAQVSWLTIFVTQIYFASTGRIGLHIRFGRWAMALSAAFILLGLVVSFDTFGRHIANGQIAIGQRRLFGFLRDVIVMSAWFGAGWAYRHKPDVHKRIMVVALMMIVYPAIGRMKFLGSPPSLATFMLVWPLPIYLMMIHDFVKKRIAHPVYVIGILTMLGVRLVLPLGRTETWMNLSAWLVPFYQ